MVYRRSLRIGLGAVLVAVVLVQGPAGLDGAVAQGRAAGGQDGAAGIGDRFFPLSGNGGYDVRHYDLALGYTPPGRDLTGTARIEAVATQPLRRFDLDLAGLRVDSVTVAGQPARYVRDGQELVVTPTTPIPAGGSFSTVVRYSGTPAQVTDPDGSVEGWLVTDDGALSLNQPVGAMSWFPGNHHLSDKATFDLRLTVPADLVAVSNGRLVSRTVAGGKATFGWRTTEPMASYLSTVAIGRFKVTRSAGPIDSYTAVDPRQSAVNLDRIPTMLAFFAERFGPYPFDTTGAIVDHAEEVGYALETQTRPVFPGPADRATLAHELAHQWFGDSVTPRRWQDIWLNEGFATYAEWLWQERDGGERIQAVFDRGYATKAEDRFWQLPPAAPGAARDLFDRRVYVRGAMALHALRTTVGDQAFFRTLRAWAQTRRHGNGSTPEFLALAERTAGRDLDGLFRSWLYTPGRPTR